MRKHDVCSQIDGDIPIEYMQNVINTYTVLYVKKMLCESGLPKEVQLNIVEKIIEYVKSHDMGG